MADIQLHKINEIYIEIITEPGIEQEISEYFRFKKPNHQYMPGLKKWDGYIRLFNKRTKYLYAGLLKYLIEWARDHKYTIEYNPDLYIYNDFSLEESRDFIKSLDIHSQGEPLEAREYQIVGLAKAIRYKRLTMISPTRSGKSLVIYAFGRYLLENRDCKRGLIIVPTTSLVEQMYKDFIDYSSANHWPTESLVQRLYDGYTNVLDPNTKILVSTWQSLFRLPDEFFKSFDFIVGDEAHTFSAKEVGGVAGRLVNAPYRLATTGTMHEEEANDLMVQGYFGPISKLTTTKKLMDSGHISTLFIKSLLLKHPPGTQSKIDMILSAKPNGAEKYQAELDYIINCAPRNMFIRNLSLSIEGNTLLMFHYEKHGRIIYDLIEGKLEDEGSRKLFFVNGKTETEIREEIRQIVDRERNAIIVGSFVFSTGITINNLHNVIFATPTKARIRTLQSIGRSLGLGENKTTATLYDIGDDFRDPVTTEVNYTLRHYAQRMLIYYAEKFNISHYTIQLKDKT